MTPSPGLRPGEILFALVLLGLALFAFREAHGISGFSGLTTGGAMPMTAAAVMVVAAGFILGDAVMRRRAPGAGPGATLRFLFSPRLVVFAALMAGYGAAIPWAGFLVASTAFLFAAVLILWRRGPLAAGAVTLAAIVAVWVIFRLVFQVVLPTGTLWP
ncbi:tripartite tricarboxylate transporter TctB family protein [Rhodovulum euryhalinum]|uniref:Tripartite tricarboxylate transporter TctB family protein n=1 Tax=Rhodovulum euryhalinum TaxID=35805 RepID=A0A4R2KEX3_9RHOB|nr:tripartite tricarboxylate transporter TctB family protein [Rhodovulum euryhalinum]TCO68886.1 tripartite tricarboxylate transporter TctB family protein [Rhodovulum euryhalinum]